MPRLVDRNPVFDEVIDPGTVCRKIDIRGAAVFELAGEGTAGAVDDAKLGCLVGIPLIPDLVKHLNCAGRGEDGQVPGMRGRRQKRRDAEDRCKKTRAYSLYTIVYNGCISRDHLSRVPP